MFHQHNGTLPFYQNSWRQRGYALNLMLYDGEKMAKKDLIGVWVRRFLSEYLIGEKNYSSNTQASYRDTLILLLPFLAKRKRTSIDLLAPSKIVAEDIRQFLNYLEKERKCSISTRNQRLAAIHALSKFIAGKSPELITWAQDICSVPFKRSD